MTVISDTDDTMDGMARTNLCKDEFVTMDGRTCRCLTCRPGYQAHMCNTMDPDTSYCQPCPKGQFMPNTSVLGRMEKCQFWRQCDQPHMTTSSEGGPTHDRKCTCKGEYRLTSDSRSCRFYNSSKIEPATKLPTGKSADPNSSFPVVDASTRESHWKIIGPVLALSLAAVLIVIIILFLRRKKRNSQRQNVEVAPEQARLLERGIQDIKDRDLQSKVLTFCCREVEHKIGKDWRKLGQNLLGGRLDYALEGTKDSSIEEKVCEILKAWRQQEGHSATPKVLLDALRSIRRQDIIDHLCHAVHNDPDLGMHFRRDEVPDVIIN